MIRIVTGYWKIDKQKHPVSFYDDNIKNGFSILSKIKGDDGKIVFCNTRSENLIRENCSPGDHVIVKNVEDFYVSNNFEIEKCKTHPIHVPTHDLAKVWLEKIECLYNARNFDITQNNEHTWYMWLDICYPHFRTPQPAVENWPNLSMLYTLDESKINHFCNGEHSLEYILKNVSTYCHNIAGGCYLIHKDFLNTARDCFYKRLEKTIQETNYNFNSLTDQCIFTKMMADNPKYFNHLNTVCKEQSKKKQTAILFFT
jgi:hypothetical protein